jgi:hypothetical protein
MKQVTLVSLYGQKENSFAQLVRGCTEIIQKSVLRRVFRPYHPNQIHGTIIGMEKLIGYSKHFNANFWGSSGSNVEMDFTRLLTTLSEQLPMTVQFGGFSPEFKAFESFGRSPYERSFQFQWPTNRVTIIGWPHSNGNFTVSRQLNTLRNSLATNCNINHKYAGDNDLFMVLGEITPLSNLSKVEIKKLQDASSDVEKEVRDYLASQKLDVVINVDSVSVVQYEDETLALDSTVPFRISNEELDADFVSKLFNLRF